MKERLTLVTSHAQLKVGLLHCQSGAICFCSAIADRRLYIVDPFADQQATTSRARTKERVR